MNTKVLFYIRVSTDEQAEFGYSIDMQQNQCMQFAQSHGLSMAGVYVDDGYTAKNMNRPQLKIMLEVLKKSKDIKGIVVWRLDRLCRNTDDYYIKFKQMFDKYGIQLLSATENNDMDNPYGRYMRNMQINNAELESCLTSIRTKANLKEKAMQGYFPGARVPLGYTRKIIDKRNTVVIDEEKAPYVKNIMELYSTGAYSYSDIARIMRSKGLEHRKKPCSKKLIENTLVNNLIFYTGKFNFNGEIYRGNHEPLITSELYLNILKVRDGKTNARTKRKFLYKGMVKCAKTGRTLSAETHSGAHKSGTYIYYRCPKECPYRENCNQYLKEAVIDDAVRLAFQSISITPEERAKFITILKDIVHVQAVRDEKMKENVAGQITKLKNRINQLYDDKLDGVISSEVYFQKKQKWEIELEEKTLQYSSLSKTNLELIKRCEKLSEPLENLWLSYSQQSDEKKRILLKLLSSNLFYDGSKVVITINRVLETLFKIVVFKNGAPDGIRTHAYRNHNPRS